MHYQHISEVPSTLFLYIYYMYGSHENFSNSIICFFHDCNSTQDYVYSLAIPDW